MATKNTGRRRSGDGKGGGASGQRGAPRSAPKPGKREERSGYALQDELVEEALVTGEHRDLLESVFW